MLIQMEMEPVSSCHSQRSTKQSSSSAAARGGQGSWEAGEEGAVVVNGIAKARFIMRLGLAWLGGWADGRMGVAVGRLDRAAQIADVRRVCRYVALAHTHTHTYSCYTYNAVMGA